MDCRYRFLHSSLAIVLVVSGCAAIASAPQSQPHPGRVVEYGPNGRPLSVMIKAWPESTQTGQEGKCPLYGKSPLDSTQSSSSDGSFTLKVDPMVNTYTVTYCASGYYPRADKDLRASTLYVTPRPVRMYPSNTEAGLDADLIRTETISALNNLAYLRSIDSKKFDNAIKDLPRSEKLAAAVMEWGAAK